MDTNACPVMFVRNHHPPRAPSAEASMNAMAGEELTQEMRGHEWEVRSSLGAELECQKCEAGALPRNSP